MRPCLLGAVLACRATTPYGAMRCPFFAMRLRICSMKEGGFGLKAKNQKIYGFRPTPKPRGASLSQRQQRNFLAPKRVAAVPLTDFVSQDAAKNPVRSGACWTGK